MYLQQNFLLNDDTNENLTSPLVKNDLILNTNSSGSNSKARLSSILNQQMTNQTLTNNQEGKQFRHN
jgi:hypothetical protein